MSNAIMKITIAIQNKNLLKEKSFVCSFSEIFCEFAIFWGFFLLTSVSAPLEILNELLQFRKAFLPIIVLGFKSKTEVSEVQL